jgi:GMP synthase-like glutamine amidotransferase
MERRKVKVAIIDNSVFPEVYKPVSHWAGFLDVPWESFRAPEGRLPNLRGGHTHIILTGSEASITERQAWAGDEAELVREAVRRGFPVLGSCYGHQLLALALRGPGHARRCLQPEIGWIRVEVREPSLFNRKGWLYAFSSHFDEVFGLDDDFLILASTPRCPVQAFGLKRRPVWGIQFHPEMDIPAAREFMNGLVRLGLPTSPLFAEALHTRPRDSGVIREIVRHFLSSGQAQTKP